MKIRQIEIFRAVMAGGSTTAGAVTLGLSQSAVSRQLTQLEEELGFELFERSNGRLLPRPEAFALMDEVGELASLVARLKRYTEDLRAGTVGQRFLRVAVPHSFIATVMPEVIETYLAERHDASVELIGGHYDAIEQMVLARVADLGFVSLPPRNKGFEAREIVRSESVCIMPAGHPLADRPNLVPRDLSGHQLIMLGRQRPARLAFERQLRRAGVFPIVRIEVHSVEATCGLVARGLGVAVVPELIAGLYRHLPIAQRPFSPCIHGAYGIVTLKGAPMSRSAEAFTEILKNRLEAQAST